MQEHRDHTLQLEICPPSEGKGATENYFDQYIHLTGRPSLKANGKSVALKSMVEGFSKTLQDTVGSVVELEEMAKDVNKTKKELDEKETELEAKQEQLQKEKDQLQKEKDQLQKEKDQLQKEKEQLQNEIKLLRQYDRGSHIMTDLLREAEYYQLSGLVALIRRD